MYFRLSAISTTLLAVADASQYSDPLTVLESFNPRPSRNFVHAQNPEGLNAWIRGHKSNAYVNIISAGRSSDIGEEQVFCHRRTSRGTVSSRL